MKKALLVWVFTTSVLALSAQWEWRNPTPFGWSFSGLHFLDTAQGYICGENGKLFKTEDAGLTWLEIQTGLDDYLKKVYFTDSNTGFLINSQNQLLRTSDGGATWMIAGLSGAQVCDIQFTGPAKGFVCGPSGALLMTTDGGLSWAQATLDPWLGGWDINAIFFVDALMGYAVGDVAIKHKTMDGGLTWTSTWEDPKMNLYDVFFLNTSTGYASGEDRLMMFTQNGGSQWEAFMSSHTVTQMYFQTQTIGYALSAGELVKTTDGGHSWYSAGLNGCSSYCFTDAQTIHAVGSGGSIFKSVDGGATYGNYTQAVTRIILEDIHFCDEMNGFAAGQNHEPDAYTEVLRTTDGGESWEVVYTMPLIQPHSIWFTDPSDGYLCFRDGRVFKTTDSGLTWNEVFTGITASVSGMFFTSSEVGYIVYEISPAAIIKTCNAGQSWEVIFQLGYTGAMRDIHFVNESTGFAITSETCLRTDNAGESWTEYPIQENTLFIDVFFVDEMTGYVGGLYSDVYKTTDGGVSWVYLPLPEYAAAMELYFTDSNTGYVMADGGRVFQTHNGGNTWTKLWNMPHIWYNGVWFTNDLTGYICGSGGVIMKTTNGGAVGAASDAPSRELLRVYPNPAGDEIRVSSGSDNTPSRITIYGSFGQKVAGAVVSNADNCIDVKALKPGLYLLVKESAGKRPESARFLKL